MTRFFQIAWGVVRAISIFMGREILGPVLGSVVRGVAEGLHSLIRAVAPWAIGVGALFLMFLALGKEQFGDLIASLGLIGVMVFVLKGMIQNVFGGGGSKKKR